MFCWTDSSTGGETSQHSFNFPCSILLQCRLAGKFSGVLTDFDAVRHLAGVSVTRQFQQEELSWQGGIERVGETEIASARKIIRGNRCPGADRQRKVRGRQNIIRRRSRSTRTADDK